MTVPRVTPNRAAEMLREGWIYLDVRTVPEFDEGHPAGAYNVPFELRGPEGAFRNEAFLAVVERRFPRSTRLVIGCRTGRRSLEAAALLLGAGFADVVDMRGGFAGEGAAEDAPEDAVRGWQALGHPVASKAAPGRSYAELTRNG